MSENLFFEINGKSILVDNLSVACEDNFMEIQMRCITEDHKSLSIIFRNVAKFNLSNISYPFQICGFEIKDYSSYGYEKDSRYFVNDYEDNAISFYCENIEVINWIESVL